ncbi:MAG: hypothetical protein VKJ24_14630, partial [Synechococcales bacterium]|nr:hypothetical protein [Synechococcales bacterium]
MQFSIVSSMGLATLTFCTGCVTFLGFMPPLQSQPEPSQPRSETLPPTVTKGTFPNLEFSCPGGDRV